MRSYLLNSVAHFAPDDDGADPEAARKAAIEAERAKVKVTSVEIKDDDDKEVEAKDDDKSDKNDKEEDDKEEEKEEIEEKEEEEQDKEELKAQKKLERLERKLAREASRRREAEKALRVANEKLEAKPDKVLTEEDVETRSEEKTKAKLRLKEFNATVDRLVNAAQDHLKLKPKEFDALVNDVTEDLGVVPAQIIDVLGELDNGGIVLAHLLKNVDDAEEMYRLKDNEKKLAVTLAKLSVKLAKPKTKAISAAPDPVEPLGGKSAGGDRLAILASKKNLSKDEMDEYVQARNAEIERKRKNGRINLR